MKSLFIKMRYVRMSTTETHGQHGITVKKNYATYNRKARIKSTQTNA